MAPATDPRPFLGIDLGGTNIQAGIVDHKDKVLSREKSKTKAQEGPDAVVKRIAKTAREAIEKSGVKIESIGGVGIGAPGTVDPRKGIVLEAANLRWNNFALGKALSDELKLPVTVDNDVNVGTWAEYVAGAGKGFNDVFGVFTGTGIGAGLVLNGRLYAGHFMTAGEIGHTVVQPDAQMAYQRLEQLASRTAIVNQITTLVRGNYPSKIVDIVKGDLDEIRSKAIAEAVRLEDPLTVDVVKHAAHFVGTAIANVVTVLSLPCVVLGGGVTDALGKTWVDWVRASFNKAVYPSGLSACKILPAKFGDDAGLLGAAMLARERLGSE